MTVARGDRSEGETRVKYCGLGPAGKALQGP